MSEFNTDPAVGSTPIEAEAGLGLMDQMRHSVGLRLAGGVLAVGGATGALETGFSPANASAVAAYEVPLADSTPVPSPSPTATPAQEGVEAKALPSTCADFNTKDGRVVLQLTGTTPNTQETAVAKVVQTESPEEAKFAGEQRSFKITDQNSQTYSVHVPVGTYKFTVSTSNGQKLTVPNDKVPDCRRKNLKAWISHKLGHDNEGNYDSSVIYDNSHSGVPDNLTATIKGRDGYFKTLHKHVLQTLKGRWILGLMPPGRDTVKLFEGKVPGHHRLDKHVFHVK